ncbi:ligase [Bifidobacterium dolichotidis]|uniref:Ligase n=1 Tax=Bifidobacterium dolichotidis TaxID=2306976 RepID=A0A430FRQ1_9BIFI|nr:lipoate--protein ligase family protein [Bifidobacterium dolichotidis]RSX55548.1 ligase [Bifidobacterium dolichotidis]
MQGQAEAKQVGGKMVRVRIDEHDHVHIDGDYFLDREPDSPDHNSIRLAEQALAQLVPVAQQQCSQQPLDQPSDQLSDQQSDQLSDQQLDQHQFAQQQFDQQRLEQQAAQTIAPILHNVDYPQIIGVDETTIAHAFVEAIVMALDLDYDESGQAYTSLPISNDLSSSMSESVIRAKWRELGKLRLEIFIDTPRAGVDEMQMDEQQVALTAADGRPRLRFWQWKEPTIVVGKYQNIASEVNEQAARDHGFTIVRRATGGGAMVIEPQRTITYSLVTPLSWSESLTADQTFNLCDAFAVAALRQIGLTVGFTGLNDIASPHGKIGGAAERKYPQSSSSVQHGVLLHHTTMAYSIDADLMSEVLQTSIIKMMDKGVHSARRRVDPIVGQISLSREAVVDVLAKTAELWAFSQPDSER